MQGQRLHLAHTGRRTDLTDIQCLLCKRLVTKGIVNDAVGLQCIYLSSWLYLALRIDVRDGQLQEETHGKILRDVFYEASARFE